MLKGAKYLKNWTKIIEQRQNLGIFSKRAEIASRGTMCPEQIFGNYKNKDENKKYFFLPLDELAAPFFGDFPHNFCKKQNTTCFGFVC